MARDQRLPSLFKAINRTTKTPVFSIVISSVIVFIAVTIRDLEHISTVTSIFSLTGYSLVNVALIIFRRKNRSWSGNSGCRFSRSHRCSASV